MKAEIFTQEELEFLARFTSEVALGDQGRYDGLSVDSLIRFCRLRDRTLDLFDRRVRAAREVIDILARRVGIDPDNTSFFL